MWLVVFCLTFTFLLLISAGSLVNGEGEGEGKEINNWAVLVDTSASWFNYRHYSNVLSMYEMVKSRGIPDERIILMLAEDIACNCRNVFPGLVVNDNELERVNMMTGDMEVDYRGHEVSVENFIRLLTNRLPASVSRNKRLESDENSNILVYMTGHGGENFLKFRNAEEISSSDLSDAFLQMWNQRRYREILFIIDTCQAGSMYSKFESPNIYSIASSKVGESSYSYIVDSEIGLSVIDKFSHLLYDFLKTASSDSTIQQFLNILDPDFLSSTPNVRDDLFTRPADQIKIFDFFANNQIAKYIKLDFPKSNTSLESKNASTDTHTRTINNNHNNKKSQAQTQSQTQTQEGLYKIKFSHSTSTSHNTNTTFIITSLLLILSVFTVKKRLKVK